MNKIKHNLPVYYNPEYNGLMVVHSKDKSTAIVSGCCLFYDDAYTNICRCEIPIKMLKKWKRVNKRKLETYSFIEIDKFNIGFCVKDVSISKEEISNDYKRCLWYKNPFIIKHWYK